MRPLLIHPGLHKTATSWLQAVPFADRAIFNSLMSHQEVDAAFVRPHDWVWQPSTARKVIEERRAQNDTADVDVISSEILTGNPFFGSKDVPTFVERLNRTIPNAKILLTVREQSQWLRSLYQQFVKRGGQLSLEDFLSGHAEPQYAGFDFISLEFHRFADEFAAAFGEANVVVLPQELLRKDMDAFFSQLSDFLSVAAISPKPAWHRAVGASPPRGSDWLLRMANALQDKPLSRSSNKRLAMIGKQLERLAYRLPSRGNAPIIPMPKTRIRRSNAKLQRYCPVDLSEYGYQIDSAEGRPGN